MFGPGIEALAQSRDEQIQKTNRKMYEALKTKNKNKNDKVDRILDFLTEQALKSTSIKDCEDDSDDEIVNTLDKFAVNDDDDDDLQSVKKKKLSKKDDWESKEETPASDSSNNLLPPSSHSFFAKSSEEPNPHQTIRIYHAQKLHVFIDNLTSNRAITDENKEEITLAFYDQKLAQHVIPHFDSLFLTNKLFTEIANSLIWFITCLKNKNMH